MKSLKDILCNENGHGHIPSWLGVVLIPVMAVIKVKDGIKKVIKKVKGKR